MSNITIRDNDQYTNKAKPTPELKTPFIPVDTTWDNPELVAAVQAYNADVRNVQESRVYADAQAVCLVNDAMAGTVDAGAARKQLAKLRDGLLDADLTELQFRNRLPELIERIRQWHRVKADELHAQAADRRQVVEKQAVEALNITAPARLHNVIATDEQANRLTADAKAHRDRTHHEFGLAATEARNVELCAKVAEALRL